MSIDDLLGRMSLAEKIGQLNHPNIGGADATGAGRASANIEARIRAGDVGSLAAGAPLTRLAELQRIAVEQSRHGIPLIFSLDVIHGHRTTFPLPVALACAFDPDLVTRTARVAAVEGAASGIALAWAPMLDVSRDARWGRCAESPGEDPFVGAVFARAMIDGYQQDDLTRDGTMMACAKHFAGYGFAEAGRDYNGADISAWRMHNVVLPPFKAAVEAGVGAVMAGFHDLAGIPCTAHRKLLHDLLRKRWGFDGLIVSDYTAIMELVNHGVAADEKEATYLAFGAGVDIDLVAECYSRFLPALVAEGRIAESDIDAACRRLLAAKKRLGLFDNPYRGLDEKRRAAVTLTREKRALAREAAAKSCVLLKNDGVLPLTRDTTIVLTGPLADSRGNMQGTWAVAAQAQDSVTVLEGLRATFGNVLYAKGANIVDDPNIAARLNLFGETVAIDPPEALIAEAIARARQADVVVACVGEAREHSGEAATRSELELPGSQRKLLEALAATGKPLVLVTFSGRPLALTWEDRHANAILHAWFPGTEAGHAIADLLSGAANPSGKLAMSFPRDSGQCPITYAEPPTGRPAGKVGLDTAGDTERDAQGRPVFRKFTTACRIEGAATPLYPFGHGLSYTRFDYGDIALDRRELNGEDAVLTASVTVRNAGAIAGEEVVQLYIGDPVASRSRPVRELKGFQKIALAPGESRTVSFRITADELAFIRAERLAAPERVFEPGEFVIEIGASSDRLGAKRVVWRCRQR
ncbi:MAG TPA: beta-glucosidase BglX [Pseudolabrys sp.]|nr:beta-glucosidase BglX [Pseudolabrys sp.]